jgi:hypothetical protein
VGRVRVESGYTVLMGDRHQREKCLSCVAVAASGGNQPVSNLNPLAVGRVTEADAAYRSAVG